jgi:predicted pyridoxine 5'-phosphate oxidase superfamily flavin-nucleotide-binding protein
VSGLGVPAALTLADLEECFSGVVPAILATASAAGVPNVTYLSRAHAVDAQRIALSNQFMSKSARNLAENPTACLILVHPITHDEFRLTITFERTERRGQVFERLRSDVDTIAALTGMQDVFRLRAADVFRVVDIEQIPSNQRADGTSAAEPYPERVRRDPDPRGLGELCARISRCGDLDSLVRVTVDGMAELLGYPHSLLLLLDEDGARLFTIASHGYEAEGVGSEVPVGEGVIGIAAGRASAVRVGSLRQMTKYSRSVRRSYEQSGDIGPGHEIPVPGLTAADSRMAVPAVALGQVVGVLAVDSDQSEAYDALDESTLTVVASLLANAIESIRAEERIAEAGAGAAAPPRRPVAVSRTTHVRFFPVDGSTFLDGDYLIKGVAGRILWSLLGQHDREGRVDFTNREVRLDPSLDLPDFKDNFESRLILLKRRLDERGAPIRIEKTGRGRFRLDVEDALRLETM